MVVPIDMALLKSLAIAPLPIATPPTEEATAPLPPAKELSPAAFACIPNRNCIRPTGIRTLRAIHQVIVSTAESKRIRSGCLSRVAESTGIDATRKSARADRSTCPVDMLDAPTATPAEPVTKALGADGNAASTC